MTTQRSQRIARSVERATPRDVFHLVEYLGRGFGEQNKYTLHSRLLEWSRVNYDIEQDEPEAKP